MSNTTGHGRWNRYQMIGGVKHKLCNGQLHLEGKWLPLESFWRYHKGSKAGKPFSHCIDCERAYRGKTDSMASWIPIQRVYFIFREIQARIGKYEACRRMGVSYALWYSLEHNRYVRKGTVVKAMTLLRELRATNEVRHRDSIHHGSLRRGVAEKVVSAKEHLYIPHGDSDAEAKRGSRKRRATAGE